MQPGIDFDQRNHQSDEEPAEQTLEHCAQELGNAQGVSIESLRRGTVVILHTRNSAYRLMIVDAPSHMVIANGGHFQDPTYACLQGARAGGNCLKSGWLCVGLRAELTVGRWQVVTSPVESIVVQSDAPAADGLSAAARP